MRRFALRVRGKSKAGEKGRKKKGAKLSDGRPPDSVNRMEAKTHTAAGPADIKKWAGACPNGPVRLPGQMSEVLEASGPGGVPEPTGPFSFRER